MTRVPPLIWLVTQPMRFFEALKTVPANPWRFAYLLIPLGIVAAIHATVYEAPVRQALASAGLATGGIPPIGKFFVAVLVAVVWWLVAWFLTTLAGGKDGRPAEVFSATWGLAIIAALVSLLALLLPVHLTLPTPPPPTDAPAQAVGHLRTELLHQLAASPREHVLRVVSFVLNLWTLAVQYTGLRVMLGDVRRARIAILPVLILTLVLEVNALL